MAKSGRKGRRLNKRGKGNGLAGGRWAHGFKPKNAVARQLKIPFGVSSDIQEEDLPHEGQEEKNSHL